jgi:cation transport ATPase
VQAVIGESVELTDVDQGYTGDEADVDVHFPGAVCCWYLSFGRFLVKQTRDHSRKLLLDAFGKQPRFARLCRDGSEVEVPIDRLEKGDITATPARASRSTGTSSKAWR